MLKKKLNKYKVCILHMILKVMAIIKKKKRIEIAQTLE